MADAVRGRRAGKVVPVASPRLTQAFEHILDNAASFSPDAGCVRVV
jgi:signal transduction histidine kinase